MPPVKSKRDTGIINALPLLWQEISQVKVGSEDPKNGTELCTTEEGFKKANPWSMSI